MEGTLEIALYGGIAAVVFVLVKKYFASKAAQTAIIPDQPKRQPAEKRDYKKDELRQYDGSDPTKAILIGVKGKLYDVSRSDGFYGPGGSYGNFAGRDASRALAKGVTDLEVANNPDISDLTADEKETLNEWAAHYEMKYPCVGNIVD